MYLRYFGFESYPFAVTPDPAFLYLSASHREALAHLLYGAGEHGGFVSLIGEVGTGKTTLIRAVVDSDLSNLDIALCWNPHLDVKEFVATICDELGVIPNRSTDTSLKFLVDRLNAHLLAAHAHNHRTVLIVDEAQNLSRDVLEQLRLLTNLETHKQKLLRIILVGQPELGALLARHDLRQLAQRITARFRLRPLGLADTRAYVLHRLKCANGPEHLFSKSATLMLRAATGGVPRLINMVCDRALMGAYAHGKSYVGAWTILRAARESLPWRSAGRLGGWWRLGLSAMAMAAVLVAALLAWLPDIPLTQAAEWMHLRSNTTSLVSSNTAVSDAPSGHSQGEETPGGAGNEQAAAGARPSDGATNPAAALPVISTVMVPAARDQGDDAGVQTGDDTDAATSTGAATASATKAGDGAADQSTSLPPGNADLNQLLRLWGVFGAQVRSDCSGLEVGDLHCMEGQGDLDLMRRFNRPALIGIQENGKHQVLLLSQLSNGSATLSGASGTREVPLATLAKLWNGHFRIVWRSEAGEALIQPHSVGQGVVWLRRRLDQIAGKNPDSRAGRPSPIYDHALGVRLKAFQSAHGLQADGLAGPKTQMVLNGAVASPGTPQLLSSARRGTS